MNVDYQARFGDAPWFGKKREIIIGGAGGIGSWIALSLVRIGHTLYVYDMDTIDAVNLAGQFFKETSIGVAKVNALASNLKEFSGVSINAFNQRYTEDTGFVAPIMISAFDNMEARRIMFEKWRAQPDREFFLDGRMTAEYFEVFAVTPESEGEYAATLFDDAEANVLPCSFKATTHNAMGIAYVMSGLLNNFLSDDPSGFRKIPFKTDFNIALFSFNILE